MLKTPTPTICVDFLCPAAPAVLHALRETDVHRLTPLQANALATLLDKARKA